MTTIAIKVKEGTIVWVPAKRGQTDGRWRLIPKNGKGTRPVPIRILKQRGLA